MIISLKRWAMLLSWVAPSLPSRACSLLSKFPNQLSTSLLVGVRIRTAMVPTAPSAQMLLEVLCMTLWESRLPTKGTFWKLHLLYIWLYAKPSLSTLLWFISLLFPTLSFLPGCCLLARPLRRPTPAPCTGPISLVSGRPIVFSRH